MQSWARLGYLAFLSFLHAGCSQTITRTNELGVNGNPDAETIRVNVEGMSACAGTYDLAPGTNIAVLSELCGAYTEFEPEPHEIRILLMRKDANGNQRKIMIFPNEQNRTIEEFELKDGDSVIFTMRMRL